MSMRVSTNIAHRMSRQLAGAFSGEAVGTLNPNTFHTNAPLVTDAMGMSDSSGVLSFIHDSNAARTITAFYWDQMVNNANAAQGWIELGPVSTIYSETVNPWALGSVSVPEDVPIFLMADVAINNCWMGGCHRYEATTAAADQQGF